MNAIDHLLRPFPTPGIPPALRLTARIARCSRSLAIDFELHGKVADLTLPARSEAPARRHGLWEESCFEFFLAAPHSSSYFEFNLSPSGHWNVYRFTGYRQEMREVEAFESLPFTTRLRPDSFLLALALDLDPLFETVHPLDVAISAVIRHHDGGTSWWALAHPAAQPDFHHRGGFTLRV